MKKDSMSQTNQSINNITNGQEKGFRYYFSTKTSAEMMSIIDCRQALIEGFIAGLHHKRVFSSFFFLDIFDQLNFIEQVLIENKQLLDATDSLLLNSCIELVTMKSPVDIQTSVAHEKDFFIYGYCLSLYAMKKYDDCLFLQGHERESCILCNLISEETKREKARRAQARITFNVFNKTQVPEKITNNGETVE